MKLRVLSLDISASSTGWAIITKNGVECGFITTSPKLSRPKRLSLYKKELIRLFKKFKPTHIVMEDLFIGKNAKAAVVLAKFAGVTEECSFTELDIEPYIIHTNTVKSYFKAKNKEEVFNVIVDILEWENANFKKDNDLTDAIAQLLCYMDHVLGEVRYRFIKDYGYLYEVKNGKKH